MELLETVAPKKSINIKKEITRYLKKWPWIFLSMMLFFGAAKLYLRYATPQYLTKSTVKIEGLKGDTGLSQFQNLGAGSPLSMKPSASEEIPIILSRPILYDVVKDINTDVLITDPGRIKDIALFNQAPIEIRILSLKNAATFSGATYSFTPKGNFTFELSAEDKPTHKFSYNTVCNLDFGSFIVKPKPGFKNEKSLEITFLNAIKVAENLQTGITIEVNLLNTAVLDFGHIAPSPDKSQAILNTLIQEYNKSDLENKKQQSQVSLDFIDERLEKLTQDLGGIENQKEKFKRQNQVTDIVAQAQMSLENANDNTKQLLEQATQLEMVNSVLNVATKNSNNELLPTNIGLPASLNDVIGEYNEKVLTRNKTLRQATSSNPAVIELTRDIASTRSLIQDNLRKTRQTLQLNIAQINGQLNIAKQGINKFPTQEKIFRSIDRQQNLKESLYLFLLQKKEETSIANAVTMPKVRVINPAYTQASPVAPKSQQIILGSLLMGLLLPLLIIYIVFAADTEVRSKKDIEEVVLNAPVIAEIPTVLKDQSDLIVKNDLSVFAEAFRILASNLKFMINKKDNAKVLLLTSSVKGEGKTTISMNTALTLATTKKVILIGADLRNPQLGRYEKKTHLGLSEYLSGEISKISDLINTSMNSDRLDIIHSGTIPPNPTDLLDGPKMEELIDFLKKDYDYIMIDSAPMMLVSDSFHLLRLADIIIYVVRAGYTEKELLEYAATVSTHENVDKMAIVLNDVNKDELRYGYGGKYGYGYEADKGNKGFFNFLDKFRS